MVRHRKWKTRSKLTLIVYSFGDNCILTELVDRAFHKNRFTNGLLYISLYITRVLLVAWYMNYLKIVNCLNAVTLTSTVCHWVSGFVRIESWNNSNCQQMKNVFLQKTTNKNYRSSEGKGYWNPWITKVMQPWAEYKTVYTYFNGLIISEYCIHWFNYWSI